MTVFVLLTLKYTEVTHRFPQGGGVVTVAAQAMNHWVGALGGMFILVDYFLTAAISCLSGMIYLAVVVPGLGAYTLWVAVGVLVLLGLLNCIGISESAKVSLIGALVAFVSDIAILITVFSHISPGEFFHLFEGMFAGQPLSLGKLLVGFAGAFLAFSGLESISQLSPVMRAPRHRTAGIAMCFVVLTIGLTSPLLTMFSTMLLPDAARDPILQNQLISLLAGQTGGMFLQIEVAISASALLVFASNTAIIGAYHVFLALSRMEFFPGVILKRNKLRNTPHISIALATGIPILILLGVNGRIEILGDMYAFGLLGAFSLTCLGLDIVRWRERQTVRKVARSLAAKADNEDMPFSDSQKLSFQLIGNTPAANGLEPEAIIRLAEPLHTWRERGYRIWRSIDFWLGILTTFLVLVAWCTNLVSKPLATAFGGTAALIGMGVALFNYNLTRRKGQLPVIITKGVEGSLPGSVMAVLTSQNGHNDAIIRTAIAISDGKPVVFLYLGEPTRKSAPRLFEVVDPYLDDLKAKEYFGKAESQAQKAKIQRRFVYRIQGPEAVSRVWQVVHPRDIVIAADKASEIEDINPDRVRYEITANGKVAHLLKAW